ncbi:ROK family transcriptional regulator [Alkalihalobacillus macyae]|uniref:ROK family transcriptional regulator n=1 Tax=Guptibacillus hwajinpoensis TaxID=208199 RepID=UPI00273CA217|nr:ROK family transcriptional regulator [Alkalihalobacillus macyae]MDP4551122.1 ROK family transcriptional regulator [Alkalihalobacillus macyae]
MNTANGKFIKTINRKILIEKIIENGSISRSELARMTGLNKSTVSEQVNSLLDEGLLIEEESTSSTGGRKPIILRINKHAGYSFGVDLDSPNLLIHVTDLLGQSIESRTKNIEHLSFEQIIELLINELIETKAHHDQKNTPFGLVGIGIGVHGIVRNDQTVVFTPKTQWIDSDIKSSLQQQFNVPISIDNNANLCAFAEQVLHHSTTKDLFCVTMYSGIGLGIINNREIYRGFQGFSGEIGHMIVEKDGLQCPCGNRGCWECYASDKALFTNLNKGNISLKPNEIPTFLGTEQHIDIFEDFFDYVAIGLNNIINIFNPETIILNGEFVNSHSHVIPQIEDRLQSKMNNYKRIQPSQLGKHACALGGSMVILKEFYGVHQLNLSQYEYDYEKSYDADII